LRPVEQMATLGAPHRSMHLRRAHHQLRSKLGVRRTIRLGCHDLERHIHVLGFEHHDIHSAFANRECASGPVHLPKDNGASRVLVGTVVESTAGHRIGVRIQHKSQPVVIDSVSRGFDTVVEIYRKSRCAVSKLGFHAEPLS